MRGRKLSFQIALGEETRAELERWQRATTLPAGMVTRGRAVLLLAQGMALKDVMVRCQMTAKTVRKWAKRFIAEGVGGLEDRPGRGAKPSFPPRGGGPHRETGL